MNHENSFISRRQFLQRSAAGVAVVSSAGVITSCSKKNENVTNNQTMPMRPLGNTGLNVSILSFGGGSQFLKNKNGDWEPILERAIQAGINYFDTASSYKWKADMSSEDRFGVFFPQYRDKVIISTKFDARNPDDAMKEFEASLKAMKIDYVDILMIHSIEPSEDLVAFEKGIYKQMLKVKEQGMAKFIGFSSMNSSQKSKELMEKVDVDACILAMNPTQYGDFAKVALPAAQQKNVGVIAMKAMRNIVGKDATAKELLEYVWNQQGVASAVVGHYKMETLEENIRLALEFGQAENTVVDKEELETRLAHLAGPHALCWARSDYYDGMMC